MYYELSKSQKKIARMVMDKGLKNHYARALNDAEAIIQDWRQNKTGGTKEAYMKLYHCIEKYDSHIEVVIFIFRTNP